MIPAAVVPLQHDFCGRVIGIEVDVAEEDVALGDFQRLGSGGEKVLLQTVALSDVAGFSAEDGFGGGNKLPVAFGFGSGGHGAVDPDEFGGFGDDAGFGVGRFGVLERGEVGAEFVLSGFLLGAKIGDLLFLIGGEDPHDGGRVFFVAIQGWAVDAVEVGVEGVELFHGDRIKFVVVAAGAVHGESHEDGAGGDDAIDDVAHVNFFGDGAAFTGGDVAAIEAGGDELIVRGVLEEIAGQLFDGEFVEGFVGVEGVDDPVAVGPHFAVVIQVQSVGVTEAGGVEPVAAHVFAVVGRGQQSFDHFFVGVGRAVLEEGIDFRDGGGQACEVEGDAANEGHAIGCGRWSQLLCGQLSADEAIDVVAAAVGGWCLRDSGALDGDEGPVLFVACALGDPLSENVDFCGGQGFAGIGRRHEQVGIVAGDAMQQGAVFGLTGDDGGVAAVEFLCGGGFVVEPEPGLSIVLIGPVALEALVGQDAADLALKADVGGRQRTGEQQAGQKGVRSDHGQAGRAKGEVEENIRRTAAAVWQPCGGGRPD